MPKPSTSSGGRVAPLERKLLMPYGPIERVRAALAVAASSWWLVVVAAAEITAPFTLIAVGEQHVSSSLAVIVIAAAPLFIVFLALRFDPSERAGGSRLTGLLIGLAGVVAVVGIDVAGSVGELLGATAISAPPSATPSGRWCSSAISPTWTRALRWA